jgi:hypothetical protein
MIKYFSLPVLVLSFALPFSATAQSEWELKKESEDIKIYTTMIPGSSFKAFKLISTIEAVNITAIAAAILDVENYQSWMPDTEDVQLIKQFSDSHDIHYVRTAAPWPVNDRDGVYEQKAIYFKEENRVLIELNALEEYDYPLDEKVVRMTVGSGFWEITESENGIFKLVYEYHAEPGGNIPAWLANSSVVNIPFKMMENLKAMVEKGGYNNARLDFIN